MPRLHWSDVLEREGLINYTHSELKLIGCPKLSPAKFRTLGQLYSVSHTEYQVRSARELKTSVQSLDALARESYIGLKGAEGRYAYLLEFGARVYEVTFFNRVLNEYRHAKRHGLDVDPFTEDLGRALDRQFEATSRRGTLASRAARLRARDVMIEQLPQPVRPLEVGDYRDGTE